MTDKTSSVSSLFKKGKRKNWNHSLSKKLSQSPSYEASISGIGGIGGNDNDGNYENEIIIKTDEMNIEEEKNVNANNNNGNNGWIEEIENPEPIIQTGGKSIIEFESLHLNHPSDYFKNENDGNDDNDDNEMNHENAEKQQSIHLQQHHWKNKQKKNNVTTSKIENSMEFPALGEEIKPKEVPYLKRLPEKTKVSISNAWAGLRSDDSDSEDEKYKNKPDLRSYNHNTRHGVEHGSGHGQKKVDLNAITSWIQSDNGNKKEEEEKEKVQEKEKEEEEGKKEKTKEEKNDENEKETEITNENEEETNKDKEVIENAQSRFGMKKKKKKKTVTKE